VRRSALYLLALLILAACGSADPGQITTDTGPRTTVDAGPVEDLAGAPRSVILFIGDGMGFEHVKGAGMYVHGEPGTLSFEKFPVAGQMTTRSANSEVTDSAASATAMATGRKVNNKVVARAVPGDASSLTTFVDLYEQRGKSFGMVTTTYTTHATPAAFGAHALDRADRATIAWHYLIDSVPDVLFGGGEGAATQAAAKEAGYTVVTDEKGLDALTLDDLPALGQFGTGNTPYEADGLGELPHLSEMALKALELLRGDPDGFFLMIEGGRIDHAGHSNLTEKVFDEVAELDKAVHLVSREIDDWSTTLVIVTSDHETGGLEIKANKGAGNVPDLEWGTTTHTSQNVPVFARGAWAEKFKGTIDNTDIYKILAPVP
jgi:alkaline phosphatase